MGPQPQIPVPAPLAEPLALSSPAEAATIQPSHRGRRWVELAALGAGPGGRASVDLARRGRWTLGPALAISQEYAQNQNWPGTDLTIMMPTTIDMIDARAFGYVAPTFGDGGWMIRPSLALGLAYTYASFDTRGFPWTVAITPALHHTAGELIPVAEAALLVGHDLGASWGLDLGLVVTFYNQTMTLPDDALVSRGAMLQVAVGVRHRL
jgi:hypothetical protein